MKIDYKTLELYCELCKKEKENDINGTNKRKKENE
jgi:hypothetical protein